MKKYKSLALMLTAALMCGSCSLDEYNPGNATTSQWDTSSGYQTLINGCYYDLVRLVYGQAEDTYVIQSEGGTDIWQAAPKASGNWGYAQTYENYGPATSMFFEGYCGFYSTVNRCNAAIEHAETVTGLTEAQRNALVAEAHFLRAHCLFNIVEYYGGKYLPTTSTTGPITSLPTSSINDFYDVILADCEYAMSNLPVSQSVTGHVIKAAAYHLYAKACMTYATYAEDGLCGADKSAVNKTDLLNKAKTAAEYLINNASTLGVSLYDTPAQMFDENNNKSNKEALFVVTHSTVTALNPRGNYFNRVWKHFGCYGNDANYLYLEGITPSYTTTPKLAKCNGYICPSKAFIDMFGEKDTRYSAFFQDTYYVNKANSSDKKQYTWTNADATRYNLDASRIGNAAYNINLGDTAIYLSRKAVSQADRDKCRYAIYNIEDNYKDNSKPGGFFISLKKQDCPSLYAGTNASKPYSAADCIIYRLGETYLLAAEAAWRLGDNTTALKYLNVIRNRACLNHDHSMDLTSVSQDVLLDEYALEMCGEWCRWQTLKRFRAFQSRLNAMNPQNAKNWKDTYYVRPINTAEILTLTNPDEYQTDGYE